MAIITTTTRIYRDRLQKWIICPSCGNPLLVERLTNKRGKEQGFTATCEFGCIDNEETEDADKRLIFYAWNMGDLETKVENFKINNEK